MRATYYLRFAKAVCILFFLLPCFLKADPPLHERQRLLQKARKELKQEYIDMDPVIDRILDQMSNWYLHPETVDRVTKIGVWGIPSSGKTSLIQKIIKKLELGSEYFYEDLRSRTSSENANTPNPKTFADRLTERYLFTYDNMAALPEVIKGIRPIPRPELIKPVYPVLVFDEIQEIATINSKGEQVIRPEVQAIWELLGNDGKVRVHNPEDAFLDNFKQRIDMQLYRNREDFVLQMNASKRLREVEQIKQYIPSEITINLSKALVFVAGNLDSLLEGSKNFTNEVDPDEIRKSHQKLTLTDIRTGLSSLFQPADISRLGNNHIIVSGPGKKGYLSYIQKKAKEFVKSIDPDRKTHVKFSPNFIARIYQEGVFAGQGPRVTATAVDAFVGDAFAFIYQNLFGKRRRSEKVSLSVDVSEDGKESIWTNTKTKKTFTFALPTDGLKGALPKESEAKFRLAVHEAAHVTLEIALNGIIPPVVRSNTGRNGAGGYMRKIADPKVVKTKNDFIRDLAVTLGGMIAEEKVFSEAVGQGGDLESNTTNMLTLIRQFGLGKSGNSIAGSDSISRPDYFPYSIHTTEEDLKTLSQEARTLAEKTLDKEKRFWKELSKKLTEQGVVEKEELASLWKKYGLEISPRTSCAEKFRKFFDDKELRP